MSGLAAAAGVGRARARWRGGRDMVGRVGEVCRRAGALAPLLGLEVRCSWPMEHHLCAFAPDALEQLLYHLLSNAFKFTPAGWTGRVAVPGGLSTSRQRGNVCNKPLTGTSWFQTCAYLTAMVSTCCVGCAKRV